MTTTLDPMPTSTLDAILTAQLLVAWAGEGGDEPRLGWWKTDLANDLGGGDTLRRLLPRTWPWAILRSIREAARLEDARLRAKNHDPDQLVTLYRLGFSLDERLDQRLIDLQEAAAPPPHALPGLAEILGPDWLLAPDEDEDAFEPEWDLEGFTSWVSGHDTRSTADALAGRRLTGEPPESPELLVTHLVGALAPFGEAYPLPHYRVGR